MFGIEIDTCQCCGGTLRIIVSIEQPEVIAKILSRLERTAPQQHQPELPLGAPAGRELLRTLSGLPRRRRLLMDRAYEGNETRQLALDLDLIPVVPPLSTRLEPWTDSKAWYRRRNEIERLFRRLEGLRRIFSRFDKLYVMFMAFQCFALVVEALR